MSSASEHVPALDGVRGAAVIAVLAHNLNLVEGQGVVRVVSLAMDLGWVGVQLFFVLSGYLITGILLDTRHREGYWRAFIGRRALRIFPLYYAVLFAAFVIAPAVTGRPTPGHEHQVWLWTYLANWAEPFGRDVPWFPHFWSLAIEEQFYLVWPLIVSLVSSRTLSRICIGLVVAALCARVGLRAAELSTMGAYMFTICRVDALALGAMAAVAMRDPGALTWLGRHRRLLRYGVPALLAATFVLTRGAPRIGLWTQTFGYTAIAVAFAALVLDVARSAAAPDCLARAFASAPLRIAGKYSYGMYVLHTPLHLLVGLPLMGGLWPHASPGIAFGYFVVATLATFVLALVSYHLLERPFLELKRHFVPR